GAVIVVAVVVAAIVLGWVVPRKRWARDADLARWVGGRQREIASDLLSSVELVDAPARPGAPSAELVGALVSATEARIAEVDPVALVPTQEVTRARTWALATAAANLVLVAALPAFVGAGWRHLLFA